MASHTYLKIDSPCFSGEVRHAQSFSLKKRRLLGKEANAYISERLPYALRILFRIVSGESPLVCISFASSAMV